MIQEPHMPDYVLAEFMFLQHEIKALERKLAEMKQTLKAYGSFATENYLCAVTMQERRQLRPLEEIVALVGNEVLQDLQLVKVHSYSIIRVSKKETSQAEPFVK